MITFLGPSERVEADDGYIGEAPHQKKCPMRVTNPETRKEMQGRLRSRQETVNRRFKEWGVLKQVFRHYAGNHASVLHAIVVLTQTVIDSGKPLFSCEYRDG